MHNRLIVGGIRRFIGVRLVKDLNELVKRSTDASDTSPAAWQHRGDTTRPFIPFPPLVQLCRVIPAV